MRKAALVVIFLITVLCHGMSNFLIFISVSVLSHRELILNIMCLVQNNALIVSFE